VEDRPHDSHFCVDRSWGDWTKRHISGLCDQGCFYIPEPIGGWFGTVAIAVIVSLLLCVVLGVVAIARSLPRIRRKALLPRFPERLACPMGWTSVASANRRKRMNP